MTNSQVAMLVIGFLFNLIVTVSTVTAVIVNRMNEYDRRFMNMMSAHSAADLEQFAAVRAEAARTSETLRHEFGEVGAAIRSKIGEVELWGRDNYLRRTSFYEFAKEMTTDVKTLLRQVATLSGGGQPTQ